MVFVNFNKLFFNFFCDKIKRRTESKENVSDILQKAKNSKVKMTGVILQN